MADQMNETLGGKNATPSQIKAITSILNVEKLLSPDYPVIFHCRNIEDGMISLTCEFEVENAFGGLTTHNRTYHISKRGKAEKTFDSVLLALNAYQKECM